MRDYSHPQNDPCSLCQNNNRKTCNCVFLNGNDALQDQFNPRAKVLVMPGQKIRPANYWDKAIRYLLNYDVEIVENEKPDVSKYRQW